MRSTPQTLGAAVLLVLAVALWSSSTPSRSSSFGSGIDAGARMYLEDGTIEKEADQVSLRFEGPDERGRWTAVVNYATTDFKRAEPTACWAWARKGGDSHILSGSGTSQTYSNIKVGGVYTRKGDFYTSPYIHRCKIRALIPGKRYFYAVRSRLSKVWEFRTPPKPGQQQDQFAFLVLGDVGQTKKSNATMTAAAQQIVREQVDATMIVGDLSYSDGKQDRWDSWARLATPLLARAELIPAAGNHEVEKQEAFAAYQARYGRSELWHVAKRGPVTFITLSSYSNFEKDSAQYEWLVETLSKVDRKETPWLVVQFHCPFYTSNLNHQGEGEPFREAIEPLLYKYRVDLVVNGHVHAYERLHPAVNQKLDPCGPVTILIGDGGNREGPSPDWTPTMPAWSAFRQSSFGFGLMKIESPTIANWTWVRNPAPFDTVPAYPEPSGADDEDSVVLDRSSCRDRLEKKKDVRERLRAMSFRLDGHGQ